MEKFAIHLLKEKYEEHKKNKGSLYGFTITKKLLKELLDLEEANIYNAYLTGLEHSGNTTSIDPAQDYIYFNFKLK